MTEHKYPEGYEPKTGDLRGRYGDEAWELLDKFKPGALPENVRILLAGMLAGVIEKCVFRALAGEPLPEPGKARRDTVTCPGCGRVFGSRFFVCELCTDWPDDPTRKHAPQ